MAVSVMKMTALSVAKLVMRQNPMRVMLTSARGAVSQVQVADHGNDYLSDENHCNDLLHVDHQKLDMPLTEETHNVHLFSTSDDLKINLEHVSSSLQKELVEHLGPFLKEATDEEQVPNVSFNHVAEDIYRNNLYMTFRKLGYECVFTRYNHETGLATFTLTDPDQPAAKRSYYRSGQPNMC